MAGLPTTKDILIVARDNAKPEETAQKIVDLVTGAYDETEEHEAGSGKTALAAGRKAIDDAIEKVATLPPSNEYRKNSLIAFFAARTATDGYSGGGVLNSIGSFLSGNSNSATEQIMTRARQEYAASRDPRDESAVDASLNDLLHTGYYDGNVRKAVQQELGQMSTAGRKQLDLALETAVVQTAKNIHGEKVDDVAAGFADSIEVAVANANLSSADRQHFTNALQAVAQQSVNPKDNPKSTVVKGTLAGLALISATNGSGTSIGGAAAVVAAAKNIHWDDNAAISSAPAPQEPANPAPTAAVAPPPGTPGAPPGNGETSANDHEDRVLFDTNVSRISDADETKIRESVRATIQQAGGRGARVTLKVIGSADGTGTLAGNERLERERARSLEDIIADEAKKDGAIITNKKVEFADMHGVPNAADANRRSASMALKAEAAGATPQADATPRESGPVAPAGDSMMAAVKSQHPEAYQVAVDAVGVTKKFGTAVANGQISQLDVDKGKWDSNPELKREFADIETRFNNLPPDEKKIAKELMHRMAEKDFPVPPPKPNRAAPAPAQV